MNDILVDFTPLEWEEEQLTLKYPIACKLLFSKIPYWSIIETSLKTFYYDEFMGKGASHKHLCEVISAKVSELPSVWLHVIIHVILDLVSDFLLDSHENASIYYFDKWIVGNMTVMKPMYF